MNTKNKTTTPQSTVDTSTVELNLNQMEANHNTTQANCNTTQANTSQPHYTTSEPQSTTSLISSTTNQKSSSIPETSSKTTLSVNQTTIISNTSSTIASQLPDPFEISYPFVLSILSVAVMGVIVICVCILSIRAFYKQRRSSVYKEKKDTIPFETGEAKISATAVLYDDIEPEIELTFISHLRGTNEEDETKTTGNKQIIDSDLNSVNRETKDKLTKEIKETKFKKPAVLYDEIEPNKEVSFLLPFRGTDAEQELETTQNQQIIDSDTNLYVDCPNNVYDKMFVSRSHVNENQGNVYHKVDLRNNRYSLVKPIGTETSFPK